MKRLLSILLASAGCAFAGPNVRVSIDGQGKGVGLVAQAYDVRLRNIPGIVVVPFGEPADLVIQLSCLIPRAENKDIGYVWAEVALDAKTGAELQGPSIFTVGPNYRDIVEGATSNVLALDRSVLSGWRGQTNN